MRPLSSADLNKVHHWPGISKPSTKRCASPPGNGAVAVSAGNTPAGTKRASFGASGVLKLGPTAQLASRPAVNTADAARPVILNDERFMGKTPSLGPAFRVGSKSGLGCGQLVRLPSFKK